MKHFKQHTSSLLIVVLALFIAAITPDTASAVVVTINVTGTIGDVSGSYSPDLVTGQTVTATFIYDTNESFAGPGSQTTPSTEPGHEFTSFYEFSSPPYGADVEIPSIPATFTSAAAGLVVNDDMEIDGADLNGYLPAGLNTYDWIEILGSTTIDGPTGNPADGEEWTLALFSDTTWISDGSLIPDALPASYTPVMLGIEFDEFENEIGLVWVDIGSITVETVPEPSRLALLALGAFTAVLRRRRQTGS